MTLLGSKLKELRHQLGISQAQIGSIGFVSVPGYIKIENGTRQASEKMLGAMVDALAVVGHIRAKAKGPLLDELLLRNYLGSHQPFVRAMAGEVARTRPWGLQIIAEVVAASKAKRARKRIVPPPRPDAPSKVVHTGLKSRKEVAAR